MTYNISNHEKQRFMDLLAFAQVKGNYTVEKWLLDELSDMWESLHKRKPCEYEENSSDW